MSAPEESLNDQDPDYASATSNEQIQQKIYEENARNITAKKVIAIVEKEFSQEIDLKEKEILQIQERLHKTQKIFHLLRYVIITNFYNRKQCQIPQVVEKQTRIHPAIKTSLGKSPKFTDLVVPSTSTDPRFLCDSESPADIRTKVLKIEENNHGALQSQKRKMLDEESQLRKIPRYVPPKSSIPNKMHPSRGNSHKIRKRIIVGNSSKWIPPDWREDASSHKWTIYVRGNKDNDADISVFISKVRFFLHPSYRPNDVIEITSYPFHLSRRGWGEFPVRVQLHFKNALNKPMDIIHHLKLDRTYTGLQTLGSETLVDVWIHMAEPHTLEQNNDEFVESSNNDSDNFALTHKQSVEYAESLNVVNMSEEIQIKEKMSKVCEPLNSTLDSMLINDFQSIEHVKTEPIDASTFKKEHRETICHCIEHDHNYCCKQCLNSDHCTVKEENMIVEHHPENDCISSRIESNVKKCDTITSHRHNGDVQFSKNYQSSNVMADASPVPLRKAFQENDSRKILQTEKNDVFNNLEIKDTVSNGFGKLFHTSNEYFNNLQKPTNSLKNDSHLKPLHISIPPPNIFPRSNNKHILVLKDKESISLDFTNIPPSKSNENTKMVVEGVSILKKSSNNTTNAQQEIIVNNNKKTTVLKLKSANSLLLNVNENVPILKVADPRDPLYNYSLAEATKNDSLITKQEFAKSEKTANVQRAKVTLGKDKLKIQSKRYLYEAVLHSIDVAKISDTEELIRFIIRRLPIITEDARDPEYRQLHPYVCCTEEEYFAYNVGKQRAMEWYRAKTIRSFLQKRSISIDQLWSIKEIILWARLHGYTPSKNIFTVQETAATSDAKKLPDTTSATDVVSTCTEPIALQKWLHDYKQEADRQLMDNHIDDEEIDVENINDSPCKSTINRRNSDNNKISTTDSILIPLELDEELLPFHNFVCDTAREIGIQIGSEEIIPGVVYCAASRLIIRVIECFLEDLIRSSLAQAWERNSRNECPKFITLNDVRNALANREEFDIFTNEGLGSKQEFNSTEL